MGHSLATMQHSSCVTRKNRKKKLKLRIEDMVKRYQGTNSSFSFVMPCIKGDIAELMEIARLEGYNQGLAEANSVNPT